MDLFLVRGFTLGDGVVCLAALYLIYIFLRQSIRSRAEVRAIFFVTAILLVPFVLSAYFVYDGAVLDVFDSTLELNQNADNWWIYEVEIKEGDETRLVNIIRTVYIVSSLYIGATFLVWMLSAFWLRLKGSGPLAIHKALLKWAVVIIGCLICLGIKIGPILLGMGAASIILAYALKEMLENLFTGMALEMEGSFRAGEWIRLHDSDTVGRVYEKNWRVTKIRTLDDEAITIPNRLLGTEKILNYDKPTKYHARILNVGTSYNDPPVKVKEVLRTILIREPGVRKDPPPRVRTIAYSDFSINYEMKFWINDYGNHIQIEDSIMTKIWYTFKFYGILIPFPIRTIHTKEHKELDAEAHEIEEVVKAKREFLKNLHYFRELYISHIDFLARNSFRRRYMPGEHVIYKGEIGDALYIVMEGSCEAVLPDGKQPILEKGNYFGEMGLLGRASRTVDVLAGGEGAMVLRIDKHGMDVLFDVYPDLVKEFREVLIARKKELPSRETVVEIKREPLYRRIRRGAGDFFKPW